MPQRQKTWKIVSYYLTMLKDHHLQVATEAKKELEKAQNVLIVLHKNPDGDAAGSALGLYETLYNLGKNPHLFCVDPLPENLYFLPNFEKLHNGMMSLSSFDMAICVDCGADYMTGISNVVPKLFRGNFCMLNIDHHSSNDGFGRYNIVDETAASTTTIITDLLQFWEYEINHKTATCLLTGLFTDTGSFQHSNTNPRELRTAAFLIKKGGSIRQISKSIFNTNKVSVMQLWGRVMERAYKDSRGVVISHVKDEDFIETKTDPADLSGVVNFLNSVPDSEFSLLLTEKDGKVKGSFRTMKEDVDVAEIASTFGGGGHKKAAGFTMSGRLEQEVRWKIVQE